MNAVASGALWSAALLRRAAARSHWRCGGAATAAPSAGRRGAATGESSRERGATARAENDGGRSGGGDDAVDALVDTALEHVRHLGWTQQSLLAATRELGLSPAAHGLLPGGPAELVLRYVQRVNRATAQSVRQRVEERRGSPGGGGDLDDDDDDDAASSPAERVLVDGVLTRLRLLSAYRHNWHQAVALQALPANVGHASQANLELVDELWFLAGERSADSRWYSRRLSVAAVLPLVELTWLRGGEDGAGKGGAGESGGGEPQRAEVDGSTRDLARRAVHAAVSSEAQLAALLTRSSAAAYMASTTVATLVRSFRRAY